jgi:drug/metabolite transporter (DMT)-like permease
MRSPRAASALLVLAALLFAAMALVAKGAVAMLPGPEVAFVRFVIGLGACAVAALFSRPRLANWVGLVLRGVFGGSAVLLYFLTIAHLPVGVATLLNYTAPVFTAVFATVFLGERLARGTIVALVVTTAGVAMVIRAALPSGALGLGPWALAGIGSAVLSGAAVTTIREVRKTDGPWEIFGSFCLVGAIVTGVPTLASWHAPTPLAWAELGAVGALSVVAQITMTYALGYVRAAMAGVIAQLTPVAVLAFGWLLLGERMAGLALVGAALTLGGVCWGAWEASLARAEPAPDL